MNDYPTKHRYISLSATGMAVAGGRNKAVEKICWCNEGPDCKELPRLDLTEAGGD